jgi:hypothetical protein
MKPSVFLSKKTTQKREQPVRTSGSIRARTYGYENPTPSKAVKENVKKAKGSTLLLLW